MKYKEKEALRLLNIAELDSELKKRREELFRIRFGRSFGAPQNPLRLRLLRREIAQLLTWRREKGIQEALLV